MGKNTARMTSTKDRERLIKKLNKYIDESWSEVNEVSGLDPKFPMRRMVHSGLVLILKELEG